MGKQLLDGVAAVRKVPSSATPYKWGTAMRQLEARDGYDRDEIEKVLEWYVRTLARDGDIIANGNPNYIPVVWSGPAFRKKFGQLQDAMARDRAKRQPSQPKVRLRRDAIADNDTSYRDDPNYLGDD